jgi:hypothetical protein
MSVEGRKGEFAGRVHGLCDAVRCHIDKAHDIRPG